MFHPISVFHYVTLLRKFYSADNLAEFSHKRRMGSPILLSGKLWKTIAFLLTA